MNLIIDIGNTRVKAALFNQNELIKFSHFSNLTELLANKYFFETANQAIICSVVDGIDDFCNKLSQHLHVSLFTNQTKTPLSNHYKTTATLGSDRLAASVGAYYLYPNSDVLVLDCGTCVKYNFTNAKNEFIGGAISPGLAMRFKALNQFTSKLPLLNTPKVDVNLIGTNTEQSIQSGAVNGIVLEIDGMISEFKQQYPNLKCILTGGDSEYLAKQLKNSIFVSQNLVLKGLNDILNYSLDTH